MSFGNLNKEKLLYAASFANVRDVDESNTKAEIIAALQESGFSWNSYQKFIASETREPGDVPPEENTETFELPAQAEQQFNQMVLLKMERQNGTFEILGRKFTKLQPFQVMSADEAQEIIDYTASMGGGFRIASPAEAKNYFG